MDEQHRRLEVEHDNIAMLHMQQLATHMTLIVRQHDHIDGETVAAGARREGFGGAERHNDLSQNRK